ncbi:MAG: dihydroorotate dehydrogenase [Ectothiorhodospiraceae bacterium]|nr:dihydroorotate dehydrogenase [Ectothiorhodospiraceae bacterium]
MTVNQWYSVRSNRKVAEETYALRFSAPELAETIKPGQFLNVRVTKEHDPLLRRPYSISNIYGDECEIVYAVEGRGTNILSRMDETSEIGVIGPLGNPFGMEKDYGTAVIMAGGIGVAPFPILTTALKEMGKNTVTLVGARNGTRLFTDGLADPIVATDDGSAGYHGNVLDCFKAQVDLSSLDNPRIFACGPTPMLHAIQQYALETGIQCELSLETEMACGMGICQGCPIESKSAPRKYSLVCTDGPCFEADDIVFHQHTHA